MYFNNYQKEIINKISKGEVNDIYSCINSLDEITKTNYQGPPRSFQFENLVLGRRDTLEISTGCEIYVYNPEDEKKITQYVMDFIFLCDYLERRQLIRAVRLSEGSNTKFYFVINKNYNKELKHVAISNIINQIAYERHDWKFSASPAVEEFIKDKYLTEGELHLKKTQRWTKIAIFIALSGVIASTVLQIIFSGKERDVKIINTNAFPESTKVYMTPSSQFKNDSLHIRDSVKTKK